MNSEVQWVFVTVSGDIEGVEARPVPYSRSGATYLPSAFTISYYMRPGDKDWTVSSAILKGQKVLKDGNLGQIQASERFYGTNVPEFVIQLIEKYTPAGTL